MRPIYLIQFIIVSLFLLSCDKPTDTGDDPDPGKPIAVWVDRDDIVVWDGENTIKLTDDRNNRYPFLSGNNIVWAGAQDPDSGFHELLLYDGNSIRKLSSRCYLGYDISGDNVVWAEFYSTIYFWNGSDIIHLTDSGVTPFISGNNIVWASDVIGLEETEIFYYNGTTIRQISDTTSNYNNYPQISGNNIVWHGRTDSCLCALFFWNGSEIKQINDNNSIVNFGWPDISGNNVAYKISDGTSLYEIFFWDGTSNIKLGDNVELYSLPKIYGNNVVWAKGLDSNKEICFWNGSTVTQLTNNNNYDENPTVSGSNVIWQGHDGNDYEIFYWDGISIKQLTDNDTEDSCPSLQKD